MEQSKVEAIMTYYLKQQGLIVRTWNGKPIICRKPVFTNREFSVAQKEVQERFRQANVYAGRVMADPRTRALYRATAKEKGMSVRALIMADFLTPPSLVDIDLSGYNGQTGSRIAIHAADDFEAADMDVAIATIDGHLVESGHALRSESDRGVWLYTVTATAPPGTHVRVEVTTRDRPGNQTTSVANM